MTQKKSTDQDLFNRLLEGKLSPGDAEAVAQWLGAENPDPTAARLILDQLKKTNVNKELDPETISRLEARLPLILSQDQKPVAPIISIIKKPWLRYAAAVMVLLATGLFFFINNKQGNKNDNAIIIQAENNKDIPAGTDGAVLTLVDGSKMVLDSMGNGLVTMQNGIKVMLRNGQLVYNADGSSISNIGFNTMSTPKGRQFQLVLPDGSKVWLNAESSIRYPIVFTGKERKVEMTGEAYFEVAPDKAVPFRVKVNESTEIEVLGTHFNINSYENEESINTTLLEGSVRVKNKDGMIILKPGQQAQIAGLEKITVMNEVDIEKVMAWKNGVFNFQDATLQEVMRQLERWYDIEVVYEKNIPKLEFFGKMGKDLPLSTVLRGLEKSNVHFRMEEGRKLVVLP